MADEMPQMNQELANRLTQEVFTPALQDAVKKAREENAEMLEIMHGAANAYQNFLITLLGSQAAANLMQEHARHLAQVAEQETQADS